MPMPTICPFAEFRPLNPEAANEPTRATSPAVGIFHTMAGSLLGTEAGFDAEGNPIESHFGLGGPTDGPSLDGVWFQWMPLNKTADANLKANPFAISMETSDGGDASRPWSPKQLAALVRMGNWLHSEQGVPRRICPAWNESGFGWHVMFGAPGPWTPVAKTCPGPVRIRQLREVVLPAIFAGRELEDDMTPEEHTMLAQIHQAMNISSGPEAPVNQDVAYQRMYYRVANLTGALLDDEEKVLAAIAAVTAKLGESEDTVLAALTALDLDLSDEQVAAIAAAVNIDEAAIAEAVRFRLADALAG